MTKFMVIFSFVVSIIMLAWFLKTYIFSRIEIHWARMFWTRRIKGIEIWIYDKYHGSAKDYGFCWRKDAKNDFDVYRNS